jgi:hypothetical protein
VNKSANMKAVVRGNKLVLEIPLPLLKFGIENHPEGSLRVLSTKRMGRYFAQTLLEHVIPYQETPAIEHLLDAVAVEALESGEEWISMAEEEEGE